ncbi:MAG: hypothetical protein V9G19_09440 [Tetrasphaera sp.]
MAKYHVNDEAVRFAEELIHKRRYVLKSQWTEANPDAEAENAYLDKHGWDDYGRWFLGLTDGAAEETKGRYAFGFGDFSRLHRSALIACVYRAAEWNHKDVELAAHELLQKLDAATG